MFSVDSAVVAALLVIALRLILVVILALLARLLLRVTARRVEKHVLAEELDPERQQRLRTIVELGYNVTFVTLLLVTFLIVLATLNIDIGPLLASVGIAGLALSLGAQSLIKDFIGGALIFIENQFSVGDVIAVGDVAGGVERITLRATSIRDLQGRLHVVPNGEIRILSNLTADWSRALIDLRFAYNTDMAAVHQGLQSASERAQADEGIKEWMLEPPQLVEWSNLTDWGIQVTVMVKTLPGKQWGVMMKLRQYAVEALHAQGVEVAVPTQTIQLRNLDARLEQAA
jgi:small-conductance mechanosensitive channel